MLCLKMTSSSGERAIHTLYSFFSTIIIGPMHLVFLVHPDSNIYVNTLDRGPADQLYDVIERIMFCSSNDMFATKVEIVDIDDNKIPFLVKSFEMANPIIYEDCDYLRVSIPEDSRCMYLDCFGEQSNGDSYYHFDVTLPSLTRSVEDIAKEIKDKKGNIIATSCILLTEERIKKIGMSLSTNDD